MPYHLSSNISSHAKSLLLDLQTHYSTFFFSFLEAAPHSMWDLSSPNRNQTLQLKDRVLTTGSLRKSHTLFKLSLLLLCSVPLFPFFFLPVFQTGYFLLSLFLSFIGTTCYKSTRWIINFSYCGLFVMLFFIFNVPGTVLSAGNTAVKRQPQSLLSQNFNGLYSVDLFSLF